MVEMGGGLSVASHYRELKGPTKASWYRSGVFTFNCLEIVYRLIADGL